MDLARAFTKRVKRPDVSGSCVRPQISGPVALISTTNMLSYNAPDIADIQGHNIEGLTSPAPSTPNRSSLDESDTSSPSNASTEATSVGSSPSAERDPVTSVTSLFPKSCPSTRVRSASEVDVTPKLPKRALSHSKREHERLARKRSLQFSRPASAQSTRDAIVARSSVDIIRGSETPPPNDLSSTSPFYSELEQLNEVAEEFGAAARDAAAEDDLVVMQTRGLTKFGVSDYLFEIQTLWNIAFCDSGSKGGDVWI